MKEKENKELIAHMVDVLREHSAPYKEGAWEGFVKKQPFAKHAGKTAMWYYLSGAAALIALGIALFLNQTSVQEAASVNPKMAIEQSPTEKKDVSHEQDHPGVSSDHFNLAQKEQTQKSRAEQHLAFRTVSSKGKEDVTPQIDVVKVAQSSVGIENQYAATKERTADAWQPKQDAATDAHGIDAQQEAPETKHSTEDAFMRMLKEDQSAIAANEAGKQVGNSTNLVAQNRKWNIGVVLAPSLTEERLNMGGGVSVAYRISKKLSVGSGVSLVDLGLRQTSPSSSTTSGGALMSASPVVTSLNSKSPMLSAKAAETKELTAVNTQLLALDIPLDIKYQVTKQFYVSAGVSLFTVLNEDRTNHYLTTTPTSRTLQNTDGFAFTQPEFQVEHVSEEAPDAPYQGHSYSGFLNFSVGRTMPILKKVGLSVEPFVKIPIGSLSNQDMNLRYGGLRVITSF